MRRKPLAALALTAGAALALAAHAAAQDLDGPGIRLPAPASPDAGRIDDLYWMLVVVSLVILAFVAVPLALFVVRYRGRGRPRTVEGPQVRGNTQLELTWTAVPVLIVAFIVGFTLYKLPGIESVRTSAGPEAAGAAADAGGAIRVEGRKFYWQFEYPNGVVSLDRLRLPLDEATELAITSPERDVIHSLWVPRLHGKFDAIPGRTNRVRFRPSEAGLFSGVCAEFCGIQHAAMRFVVEVMERGEYDAWLEEANAAQEAREVEVGAEIWGAACAKCHGTDLVPQAPPLEGNSLLLERESLEPIVREGRGLMPPVGQGWSERQFEALLEYARVVGERGANGGEGEGGG